MHSENILYDYVRSNVPHKIDDNISNHLTEGDLRLLILELEQNFKKVCQTLLIDLEDPNTKDTPKRLAKMFFNELFVGRYKPRPDVTSFPNDESSYDGMVVIKAELKSLCAHHFQPVNGVAYVGILPNKTVLGLSKYIRLAQWCARRGTLQEKLCVQITEEVIRSSGSADVATHLAMDHGCCTNRGVGVHSAFTQTTVLRGRFLNEAGVKEEFFDNIKMQKGII